uniref:Global nitrogen transcriptional regulator n=1 Tax=Pleurostichidium falkenbergii TaxID=121064 RepID=A0A4D6UYZ9_9FLOR|nr:Global nitrogen transcriptional regulator [Pleurostichidium falkenbergii]QCH39744.1 Global nitrogen transcriptional regulator [Pleurostichidium falkenbergii]
MKWIKFFTINKIPYYIYKLNKEDSIVLSNINNKDNKVTFILSGIIYIKKVFSNKEILPIAILNENNIFAINNKEENIYYQLSALKTTYILTLGEYFLKKANSKILLEINILTTYQKTIEQYQYMNMIMSQKNILNRIIQIIFILCLKFGKVKNKNIVLPFKLSKQNIAIMAGTSENTVNKIMKKVYKGGIINELNKTSISIKNIANLK